MCPICPQARNPRNQHPPDLRVYWVPFAAENTSGGSGDISTPGRLSRTPIPRRYLAQRYLARRHFVERQPSTARPQLRSPRRPPT